MNKKIKIASTVALAGMLTLNVFNTQTLAAEIKDAIETKPVGVYSKLVEDKTVVPFILQSSTKDTEGNEINDTLTLGEIKAKFEVTNAKVKSESQVATGDTFISNGKEHTVIIYGDVNKDGKITMADALSVQDYYKHDEQGLDGIQREAANVADHNGKITMADALKIQDFYKGATSTVIDNVPPAEEVAESNYTVIVNGNGIVNNTNYRTSKIEVKLAKTLDKATSVKVIITDGTNTGKVEKTISIAAHTDYAKIENVDLSSIKDGNYEAKLVDGDNDKKELGKFSIAKNTVTPIATNVKVLRVNTRTAKLSSLESGYNGDITKVEYTITRAGNEVKKGTINVQNNTVSDYQVIDELDEGIPYNFTYTAVNSYGSKSEPRTLIITSDANVKANAKVKIETDDTSFAWDSAREKTYVVTIYKDGNPLTTKEFAGTGATMEKKVLELVAPEELKAGKYKVSVYVKGDASNTASETVTSEEIEIVKLESVTDLKFSNENGKVSLSWTNPNAKKVLNGANATYTITLYEIDEKGKEVLSERTITVPTIDKNKVENIAINNDTIYIAKVKINAGIQDKYINSDEVSSSEFYKVTVPTITGTETSSTSVTLTAPATKINGKTTTYKVEVVTIEGYNENYEPQYGNSMVKDVEVKEDKIIIDGLENDKLYAFKLIVSVDGNEVKSGYTGDVRTLPDLSRVTLVANQEQVKEAGKAYYDRANNKVYILGNVGKEKRVKEIRLYDYDYSERLNNQLNIIKALAVGDEASISDTNISLVLNENANTQKDLTTVDMSKVVLNVTTNEFMKRISTNGVKELNLLAGLFDVSGGAKAQKVTLSNGVDITSANETYTINAGSRVRINGVYVTTKENIEIKPTQDENTLQLAVSVKDRTTNDLIFENTSGKVVDIKFVGKNANGTDELLGKVTIKTNGGTITVSSDNKVAVKAPLNVEVNKGEATVTVTDPYMSGDKTVSVNKSEDKDAKLTATVTAKKKSKYNINNVSVDATVDELKAMDAYKNLSKDEIQKEIKNYLDSFKLSGTKAKIYVDANGDVVTITFTEETDSKTISNIK